MNLYNSDGDNQTIILSALFLLLLQQGHRCSITLLNQRWTCQEVCCGPT